MNVSEPLGEFILEKLIKHIKLDKSPGLSHFDIFVAPVLMISFAVYSLFSSVIDFEILAKHII